MSEQWLRLGSPRPETLTQARLQLHWAVQLVASVGKTYLEPLPDDSHPNMGWDGPGRSLAGHVVRAGKRFQAALRLEDLTLSLRRGNGDPISHVSLDGSTLAQGHDWLSDAIVSHIGDGALPLQPAGYEIPHHAVGRGGHFSLGDGAAFQELSRWFANADSVLTALAAPYGAPVRCWPHHFDIGPLIYPEAEPAAENAPSIGVGMTPGDDSYPVPYWYLSPYTLPRGRPSTLPALPDGTHWHTEGWFGAVLPADTVCREKTAQGQLDVVSRYLKAAWDASRIMMEP